LIEAIPFDDYRISLTYDNNGQRVYVFTPNLNHKFYSSLADMKLFMSIKVVDGELIWSKGQDFCPHTLYEQSVPVWYYTQARK